VTNFISVLGEYLMAFISGAEEERIPIEALIE
jgi:hypothetical protein